MEQRESDLVDIYSKIQTAAHRLYLELLCKHDINVDKDIDEICKLAFDLAYLAINNEKEPSHD